MPSSADFNVVISAFWKVGHSTHQASRRNTVPLTHDSSSKDPPTPGLVTDTPPSNPHPLLSN
eukprot:766278-Hanusia_phi.AAC.2